MTSKNISMITFSFIICLLVIFISHDIIPAVIWGAILAVAFRPLQKRMNVYMSGVLSASLICFVLSSLILYGVGTASYRIAGEVHDISHQISTDTLVIPDLDKLPEFIRSNGMISGFFRDHTHHESGQTYLDVKSMAPGMTENAKHMSGSVFSSIRGASGFVETVMFAFISMFCFLSSYEKISSRMLNACQFLIGRTDIMIHGIRAIRGTVSGLVLVGIGEGMLIAPAFIFCQTPHPLVMTILISIAAMIPFAGPPTAIAMSMMTYAMSGHMHGIIVACISLTILFTCDHLVRPIFISGSTKLPFLATLIGILGGMHAMGFLGLFMGPSIMSVAYMLWLEISCSQNSENSTETVS